MSYDGTDYSGWQVQPGRATIQGLLGEALQRVTGESVVPQGSGRTDAGVHALGQVASFALDSPIPESGLLAALNGTLPAAVRVLSVERAADYFHARKSARGKTYRYRIYRGAICPPFIARYVWHHPFPLDEHAMAEAAPKVEGEHDFTSFAAADPEKGKPEEGSAVRTILHSRFDREGDELIYTVRGSGFLHHMVRNLVGMFILVGKGTLAPGDISRIIAARDRSANPGATVPAGGLFLVSVDY